MNTKTIEEVRLCVLAELARLTSDKTTETGQSFGFANAVDICGLYWMYKWPYGYNFYPKSPFVRGFSINTRPAEIDQSLWICLYKLLGLEARDAVEAERENYKALEALMIQRNEQINAERARDAKLVEAVKKQINNLHWDDYAISVGESLERAIAAHKEGGAQG